MGCLECKNLEQAFESGLSKYIEARSDAYYRVSTELAAKKKVDMERARNDFEEHQLICAAVAGVRPFGTRTIRQDYSHPGQRLTPCTLRLAESFNYKFASSDWST
jgi:hypothetical protein